MLSQKKRKLGLFGYQYFRLITIMFILLAFTSILPQDHSEHLSKDKKKESPKQVNTDKVISSEGTASNPKPTEDKERNPLAEKSMDNPIMKEKDFANDSYHSHKGPFTTPAGLMIPHVQKSDDWMIEYMYMGMDMKTLYNGSHREDPYKYLAGVEYNPSISTIPSSQSTSGTAHNHGGTATNSSIPDPIPSYYIASLNPNPYRYMEMPVSMKMEMTMISLMKNINDKIAIMIMLPYVNNSMQMISGNLEKSFMRTQGIGDIGATIVYKILEKENHTINLQLGITAPTGSIDEKTLMPLMGKQKSPYNMQPGTGTYNTLPGFSYIYNRNKFSLGAFGQIVMRNGKNDNSYKFGNRYELSTWVSYAVLDWIAPTFRVTSTKWDNISGSDTALDSTMDPQNDPNRQGGRRVDFLGGFNFYFPSLSEKIKAGLEFGKPVYQHLNGPQLGANTLFNFRLQASF
jgi:hypothetical protein